MSFNRRGRYRKCCRGDALALWNRQDSVPLANVNTLFLRRISDRSLRSTPRKVEALRHSLEAINPDVTFNENITTLYK